MGILRSKVQGRREQWFLNDLGPGSDPVHYRGYTSFAQVQMYVHMCV